MLLLSGVRDYHLLLFFSSISLWPPGTDNRLKFADFCNFRTVWDFFNLKINCYTVTSGGFCWKLSGFWCFTTRKCWITCPKGSKLFLAPKDDFFWTINTFLNSWKHLVFYTIFHKFFMGCLEFKILKRNFWPGFQTVVWTRNMSSTHRKPTEISNPEGFSNFIFLRDSRFLKWK